MTMCRNERRNIERELKKMGPRQIELLDKLSSMKADTMIPDISSVINDCYFSAMRENHVSKKRADAIIERTAKLIDEESSKEAL